MILTSQLILQFRYDKNSDKDLLMVDGYGCHWDRCAISLFSMSTVADQHGEILDTPQSWGI